MIALLFVAAYAPQFAGHQLTDPAEEARAEKMGKLIRCAVCQGLSVADSPAPMAQAMMDRIRDEVHEGKSDNEIREYFVARYGEWILLSPPRHGFNWFVWLAPLLLVLGGLVFVVVKPKAVRHVPPPPTSDRYIDAIRREVEK